MNAITDAIHSLTDAWHEHHADIPEALEGLEGYTIRKVAARQHMGDSIIDLHLEKDNHHLSINIYTDDGMDGYTLNASRTTLPTEGTTP